ncbi:MAG: hypothetical protein JRK53_19350, partial [Deltaproteobacteria bacterium]|nr:hypothetical protein [Deltaproteobacteria bacterium]
LMGENHLSDEQDVRENQIGLESVELNALFDDVRSHVDSDLCAWLVTSIVRKEEVQDKIRELEEDAALPEPYY